MNKYWLKTKTLLKIILRKEIFQREQIQVRTTWYGNLGAGFYVNSEGLNESSIVYSFGIGEDISFDREIINQFGCNVFAFDPTPKSIKYIKENGNIKNFHFYPYGVLNYDGLVTFYLPENENNVSCTTFDRSKIHSSQKIEVSVKKIKTIMNLLNHTEIDVLKMDIEGSEYDVIEDIIKSNIKIKQLLVEFHHRFPQIGLKKTIDCIKLLNDNKFWIAKISESGEEYTFIKK